LGRNRHIAEFRRKHRRSQIEWSKTAENAVERKLLSQDFQGDVFQNVVSKGGSVDLYRLFQKNFSPWRRKLFHLQRMKGADWTTRD
jgi:hypothetical protein